MSGEPQPSSPWKPQIGDVVTIGTDRFVIVSRPRGKDIPLHDGPKTWGLRRVAVDDPASPRVE